MKQIIVRGVTHNCQSLRTQAEGGEEQIAMILVCKKV